MQHVLLFFSGTDRTAVNYAVENRTTYSPCIFFDADKKHTGPHVVWTGPKCAPRECFLTGVEVLNWRNYLAETQDLHLALWQTAVLPLLWTMGGAQWTSRLPEPLIGYSGSRLPVVRAPDPAHEVTYRYTIWRRRAAPPQYICVGCSINGNVPRRSETLLRSGSHQVWECMRLHLFPHHATRKA